MKPVDIYRLPDWGLILIDGADASNFLQGQLTNSVLGMTPCQSGTIASGFTAVRFSGYCSAKGRLLASAWICLLATGSSTQYACFVSRDLASSFAKRLAMFVLRSKVTIRDVSNEWFLYGALPAPETAPPTLPVDAIALALGAPVNGSMPQRIVFASQVDLADSSNAKVEIWNASEVASGIPRIVAATQDQFVPQMINLESLGAIDFKKGCYPGQEVVARSQYRGAIKRRLFLARVKSPELVKPGMEIFHEDDPMQPAGMIVLSAINPDHPQSIDLQVECKLDRAQSGKLHLGGPAGPPLELLHLPYPFIEI